MNLKQIHTILKDTDFVHTSGTEAEMKVAEYLKAKCEELGLETRIEGFKVSMATMKDAHLWADGEEIPCKGYLLSGTGTVEAPFIYLPDTDKMSLRKAKGKIVMIDGGMRHFLYHDLLDAGIAGFITYDGNVNYRDNDIDQKELREAVANGTKTIGANINAKDAVRLVKNGVKSVKITIDQDEFEGESHNVIAEIPGKTDEWIAFTAHYDTTSLSHGSYDNMTGCIGLLAAAEAAAKTAPHNYGLRFIFCGSEERGLLGSKAYVADHKDELDKIALNINLDMIGSIMGKFIACCTAEEKMVGYISCMAAENGWGIAARQGVYSSDSTPFADNGVPAVSFARLAGPATATIHNRYDTMAVLSEKQIFADCGFITMFAMRMADAVMIPFSKDIPDNVKKELDEYLNRKRKD